MRYGRELSGYPFNLCAFLTRVIIVIQRFVYSRCLHTFSEYAPIPYDYTEQNANDAIHNLLQGDDPCMIARFGSGEIETTLRHLDISCPGSQFVKSLRILAGRGGPFWWDNSIRAGITWIAGVFPPTNETLDAFGARVLIDCREIDLLGGWLAGEKRLKSLCFPNVTCIPIADLEPFHKNPPWTTALEGKTVLLVHPFEATIRQQYSRRRQLFQDPRILPDFTLKTYKTVQSLAGNTPPFPTWFDALDHMCKDISALSFDVAIIGAGAYGMSVAAHVKRMGKKAIHMGGATQLLFGIKGGRWDQNPAYAKNLYNEHWTRPLPEDHPKNHKTVEGGSYW